MDVVNAGDVVVFVLCEALGRRFFLFVGEALGRLLLLFCIARRLVAVSFVLRGTWPPFVSRG